MKFYFCEKFVCYDNRILNEADVNNCQTIIEVYVVIIFADIML